MIPTHTHITEYADPVLRPASPASSLGSTYTPDQTSPSDSELSDSAFEKKCLEQLALDQPSAEEIQADRDPLVRYIGPDGKSIWVGDEEAMKAVDPVETRALSEHIVASLTAEIDRLREDHLYEQILLRDSGAALEPQPSTNDINALMRSMMGPTMDIGTRPYMGRNSLLQEQRGKTSGAGIVDGPWNNFGKSPAAFRFDRRESEGILVGDITRDLQNSTASTPTVGKRSRNGAPRKSRRK